MLFRVFILVILLAFAPLAKAAQYSIPPENGALATALKNAKSGDILRLSTGTYKGNFIIDVSVTIEGDGNAKIIGNGVGSPIIVTAPNVTIRGLEISGSGSSHETMDSGVRLLKGADNAIVENNKIIGNLVGVNIHGAKNAVVRRNIIVGRQDKRMNDRGNGIYIWNALNAKVIENDVQYGRDGIFVTTSKKNEYRGNRFRDLRFAIHYMYVHDTIVAQNISINNHLGYAIMFSKKVTVIGNLSRNDRDYGIMLNYANSSKISDNIVERAEEKCVFIYNSHKNTISGNRFERCEIGIHFSAGSERNEIYNNSFLFNQTQVKYVGTKWVDWSANGLGNFWSDNQGFDLNGNGIADGPYRPNDVMDRILWTQPAAKALMGSPAVQLIKWSQSAFPALLPGGVIDSAPLMRATSPAMPIWKDIK